MVFHKTITSFTFVNSASNTVLQCKMNLSTKPKSFQSQNRMSYYTLICLYNLLNFPNQHMKAYKKNQKLFLFFPQGDHENKSKGSPLLKVPQQNKTSYPSLWPSHKHETCFPAVLVSTAQTNDFQTIFQGATANRQLQNHTPGQQFQLGMQYSYRMTHERTGQPFFSVKRTVSGRDT